MTDKPPYLAIREDVLKILIEAAEAHPNPDENWEMTTDLAREALNEPVDINALVVQRELLREALRGLLIHVGMIADWAGQGDLDTTNEGAALMLATEDFMQSCPLAKELLHQPLIVLSGHVRPEGFEERARAQVVSTIESGDLLAIARNIVNEVLEEYVEHLKEHVVFDQAGNVAIVKARQAFNDEDDAWVHDMLRRTVAPYQDEIDRAHDGRIEAQNPGIDMDEVRADRARRRAGTEPMTSTQAKVLTLEDGTVTPAPGWMWCPQCNGEGEITSMSATPHLDEVTTKCGACLDGVVRAPESEDVCEVDLDDIPDDEPEYGHCSACNRRSWDRAGIGQQCNMPQSDGSVCLGIMQAGPRP